MLSLRELQLRFVAALYENNDAIVSDHLDDGILSASARLGVYRNNLREGFIKTLALEFPVVERLVGADFFRRTALDFQSQHPSRCGDLTPVGTPFAEFLRARFAAGEYAWLPDIAALEWALQCVAIAPDCELATTAALAQVPAHRYPDLYFESSPATRLVESRYPILRIWQSNQPDAAPESIDLDSGGEYLLVRRRANELEFVKLTPTDFTFARMLARRTPLGLATDASLAADPQFDLGRALRSLMLAGAFARIVLDD
ncbi:MAG: DNA-binding domain-containing protein [Pseudomonadota bacterium]